jgi:NAD(P)-dependent dehydrogenase (short-subunit alcohol dehydrogenase family)
MELTNCTALVTGANRGIGAAFVTALLEAGASKVYAACRNPGTCDLEFDGGNPCIELVTLDVTEPQSIHELAAVCGDVQLLVNNAGLSTGETLLNATDVSAARREMEVNYFGPLQMSRAFAPILKRNGGGAIVNVLSAAAIVSVPNMGGYSPSKFAARAMGIALRAELTDQNTQVQNLIVGSIDTRMAAHVQGKKEPPATVAKAGLKAVRNNIPEVDTDAFAVNVRAAQARDPARLEQQMAAALKLDVLSTGR